MKHTGEWREPPRRRGVVGVMLRRGRSVDAGLAHSVMGGRERRCR